MNIDISKFLKKHEDPAAEEPTKYGMLRQLNITGYNMYAGTVTPNVVKERRIKNKAARKARRINRVAHAKR